MSMGDDPQLLICNRLTDMTNMHPQQDDTHKCGKCGHPVGIYPSGQKALKRWPKMAIRCVPCAAATVQPTDINVPAGSVEEILQEARDSKPVVQQ
jgi:hypothetical protein